MCWERDERKKQMEAAVRTRTTHQSPLRIILPIVLSRLHPNLLEVIFQPRFFYIVHIMAGKRAVLFPVLFHPLHTLLSPFDVASAPL